MPVFTVCWRSHSLSTSSIYNVKGSRRSLEHRPGGTVLLQPLRLRPRVWTAAQHCRQGRAVETKCPCCLLTPSAPGAGNTHFLLNVSSSFFRVICTDCSLPSKSFILQRPKHWREARQQPAGQAPPPDRAPTRQQGGPSPREDAGGTRTGHPSWRRGP